MIFLLSVPMFILHICAFNKTQTLKIIILNGMHFSVLQNSLDLVVIIELLSTVM